MFGKSALMCGIAAAVVSGAAQGALTINESDISGGQYTYRLNFGTYESQFVSDPWNNNNMELYVGSTKYVRRANPSTGAYVGTYSLTYKFDFSSVGAGYQITAINTQEVLCSWTLDGKGSVNIKYSTDGVNFSPRFSLAASTTGYNFIDTSMLGANPSEWSNYNSADLQNTSVFYYRVEYDVLGPTSEALSSRSKMGWGQKSATATNAPFQATFTLQPVPEPASLAIIGLISCGLMARKRHA